MEPEMGNADVPLTLYRVVTPSLGAIALFFLFIGLVEEWLTRGRHREPILGLTIGTLKWWCRIESIMMVYFSAVYTYRVSTQFNVAGSGQILLTLVNFSLLFAMALIPAAWMLTLLHKSNRSVTQDEVNIRHNLRESQQNAWEQEQGRRRA